MRKSIFSLLLLSAVLVLFSCKKNKDKYGDLTINLSYAVDASAATPDSLLYTTPAGYKFSLTRLVYYISDIVLTMENNDSVVLDGYYYADMENVASNTIVLPDLPEGTYKSMRFQIGLNATRNVTDGLPSTTDNVNMAWPDLMGGGYHFMKMEGFYIGSDTLQHGYAMHLGKNANLVTCTVNNLATTVTEDAANTLNLSMNINEWYRNPAIYDFETDGTSIMMNDAAMLKLATNGSDVFSKKN